MSLQQVSDVRNRIDKLEDKPIQIQLKTTLAFGLRIGEGCGYVYPSEKHRTQPTGMLLWAGQTDWQPNMRNRNEIFVLQSNILMDTGKEPSREEISQIREKVLVLSIVTEKRQGFNRQAAIPLNPIYERWSQEIYDYITKRQEKGPLPRLQKLTDELSRSAGRPISIIDAVKTKDGESIIENYEPVFPYKRQEIYPVAAKVFQGLTYPIAKYNRIKLDPVTRQPVQEMRNDKLVNVYELIPSHPKKFTDHALRHLRATELKTFFLVEATALNKFMGWTASRNSEASAMQERYVDEPWKEAGYFPCLLLKRA